MSTKVHGILFGLGVTLVAEVVGLWFGMPFKVAIAILFVAASIWTAFLLRHRKAKFFRDLAEADRATQDAALAELDAGDRRDMLRRLGREES
jgi:hypothetical protein